MFRTKIDAGAEIGVHRTLAIGGDENHRAGRRRIPTFRLRFVVDTLGADIMLEDRAQLVGGHLAEIGSPAAEPSDAGCGIAGRPARRPDRRAHLRIKQFRPLGVDTVPATLYNSVLLAN